MTQLGIGSGLGTRDSTCLDLGFSPPHLAQLVAWNQSGTRFGLEARPGSKLWARPTQDSALGLDRSSARLISVVKILFIETKHEQRRCKTITVRRESAKIKADEKRERKCHEKKYGTTRGYTLPCFRTEQRQKAALRCKIYAVGTVPTLPVIAW